MRLVCPYHNKPLVFDMGTLLWKHTDGDVCYESNFLFIKRDEILSSLRIDELDYLNILSSRITSSFVTDFFHLLNKGTRLPFDENDLFTVLLASDLSLFLKDLAEFTNNVFPEIKVFLEDNIKDLSRNYSRILSCMVVDLTGRSIRDNALKRTFSSFLSSLESMLRTYREEFFQLKFVEENPKFALLHQLRMIFRSRVSDDYDPWKVKKRYKELLKLDVTEELIKAFSDFLNNEKSFQMVRPLIKIILGFNRELYKLSDEPGTLFDESIAQMFRDDWNYDGIALELREKQAINKYLATDFHKSIIAAPTYLIWEIGLEKKRRKDRNFDTLYKKVSVAFPINTNDVDNKLSCPNRHSLLDQFTSKEELRTLYHLFYLIGFSFYSASLISYDIVKEFLEKVAGKKFELPTTNIIHLTNFLLESMLEEHIFANNNPDFVLFFGDEVVSVITDRLLKSFLNDPNLPDFYREMLRYYLSGQKRNSKFILNHFLKNLINLLEVYSYQIDVSDLSMIFDSFFYVLLFTTMLIAYQYALTAQVGMLKVTEEFIEKKNEALSFVKEKLRNFDTRERILVEHILSEVMPLLTSYYLSALGVFFEAVDSSTFFIDLELKGIDLKETLKNLVQKKLKGEYLLEKDVSPVFNNVLDNITKWLVKSRKMITSKTEIYLKSKSFKERKKIVEEELFGDDGKDNFNDFKDALNKIIESTLTSTSESREQKVSEESVENAVDSDFSLSRTLGELKEDGRRNFNFKNALSIPVTIGTLDITRGFRLVSSLRNIVYINPYVLKHFQEKLPQDILNEVIEAMIAHEKAKIIYGGKELEEFFNEIVETREFANEDIVRMAPLAMVIFELINDARVDFLFSTVYPKYLPSLQYFYMIFQVPLIERLMKEHSDNPLWTIYQVLFLITRLGVTDFSDMLKTASLETRYVLERLLRPNIIRLIILSSRSKKAVDAFSTSILLAIEISNALKAIYSPEEINRFIEEINKSIDIYFKENESAFKDYTKRVIDLLSQDLLDVINDLFNSVPIDTRIEIFKLFEKDLSVTEIVDRINKMLKQYNISIELSKAGAYAPINMHIPKIHDYIFYLETVKDNEALIQKLREKVNQIKIDFEEKVENWGDIFEERLLEAYIWSMARDIPAPKAFSGYSKVLPKLDIILHLDLSGSMYGEAAELVMKSAIIVSEALKPLIEKRNSRIQLSISGFGTGYMIIKYPKHKVELGNYNIEFLGGTAIFETLRAVTLHLKNQLYLDSKKLIFIFTDTFDSEEDLQFAADYLREIRENIGNFYIITVSTSPNALQDLERFSNKVIYMHSLNDLPKIIVENTLTIIKKWGIQKLF